ncbi:MAG: hypothetical protein AAGG46_11765 [Planctomycetota bacterium]
MPLLHRLGCWIEVFELVFVGLVVSVSDSVVVTVIVAFIVAFIVTGANGSAIDTIVRRDREQIGVLLGVVGGSV